MLMKLSNHVQNIINHLPKNEKLIFTKLPSMSYSVCAGFFINMFVLSGGQKASAKEITTGGKVSVTERADISAALLPLSVSLAGALSGHLTGISWSWRP